MKQWLIAVLMVSLTAGLAQAAERFQDQELGVKLEVPEGFTAPDQRPPFPEGIGTVKALFGDLQHPQRAAFLMVHRMELPDGVEAKAFEQALEGALKEQLGPTVKVLNQQTIKVGNREGFLLDFEAPGNGKLPEANGTIRHHVRWYLLEDGPKHFIGVVYHSVEDVWKELEPKYEASFKSLMAE
jgi:hypothetical protein